TTPAERTAALAAGSLNLNAPFPFAVHPAAASAIETGGAPGENSSSVAPDTVGSKKPPVGIGALFLARQSSFSLPFLLWSRSFAPSIGSSTHAFSCRQKPEPLHTPGVHRSPLPGHGVPAGSLVHVDEQQSPSSVLPSSHVSPGSRMKLPHTGGRVQLACWNSPPFPVNAYVSLVPWPSTRPQRALTARPAAT